MKLTARLLFIALAVFLVYAGISYYLPRRAAKQDLAGIEQRLENIERSLEILVDRRQRGEPATGANGESRPMDAGYPPASDDRMDRLLDSLDVLTRALERQAGEDR